MSLTATLSRYAGPMLAAFALAALHTRAEAQSSAIPAAPAVPPAAAGMFSLPDGVRMTLGASAIMVPKFEGSSSYTAVPVPIFKIGAIPGSSSSGADSLFKSFDAKSLDDISFGLAELGKLELGVLTGYRFGRQEKDSPRLRGLGDIEGGLVAGAFAKYDFGPLFLRASFHHRVTGDETGYLVRLATGREYKLNERITISADAYMDLADDAYMATYFGVTTAQSARSGLRTFDAGAGLKSAGILLGTEIELIPLWTLAATAGYTRLLGDAASSPIVESPDRYEVRLGLSRAFDLRWK